MKFSGFAVASVMAILLAPAMATPIADAAPAPVDDVAAAKYTIHCTGGQNPAAVCTNGHKKDGCRCDSHGTYLCDPSSLSKSGGQCAKCGCRAE